MGWPQCWPTSVINDKIKADVVHTFGQIFDETIQSSYSNFNKKLKLGMYNIIKHALTEMFHAGQGCNFDEIQLACLMKSERIVEQIV